MTFPVDEKWGPLQSYVYGQTQGKPAEILFFHGNGFSAPTYDALLRDVGQERSVHAFDLQGHGASDDIANTKRLANWRIYRDNVSAALKQNGPSILMGHSMGSVSAMFTAMENPESVKALILIEPVFLKPIMGLGLGFARLFGLEARGNGLIPQARARRQYFETQEEAVEYFLGRKGLATWPEDAIRAYAASILRPRRDGKPGLELSLLPELEAQNFASLPAWIWPRKPLNMPVLVLHGGHKSSTVWNGRVDWLRKVTPQLQKVLHTTSGHMLPVDQPAWTGEQVREFLNRALN